MFKERIKTHHSAMSEGRKYMAGMDTVENVLREENRSGKNNAVIYIHVPFCNKICSFCNMRRSLQKPTEDYCSLIRKEIEKYAELPYIKTTIFDAVYFGGGTPTTLPAEGLSGIVKALKQNFRFTEDAEFSVETTVTELTEEKQEALTAAGVNRFSVGVQTFDDRGREKMGRIGTGDYAYQRLEQLKRFPGVTVSMDLIYNYPGQTMDSLEEDLDRICGLDLDGFSMYSLINMKNASIDRAQDERNDEKMFFYIAERMKAKGYRFLELTKMVKGDRYRYIMNRHQGADTLPLGAGAGGSVNHLALMNQIDLTEYARSVENFRDRSGMLFVPEYDRIVRFKGDIQTTFLPRDEALYGDRNVYLDYRQVLSDNGMTTEQKGIYRLTDKGIFWGNTISRELSEMIS